jgi:hypothetical protein
MARKVFDCADVPEELSGGCRVAVLAEDAETLVEEQLRHAIAAHGVDDTAETRAWIRSGLKDEAEWLTRRVSVVGP